MRVVPVDARNRVQWVRGEQQHLPRHGRPRAAATCCTASRRPRRCAAVPCGSRRSTTSTTSSSPETHFGLRGLGMRRARAGRGPAVAPRDRRDAASTRATSSSTCGCRTGEDRRRPARRRPAARGRGATPEPELAPAPRPRRPPGGAERQRASGRTRTSRGCSRRSRRSRASAGRSLVVPGYPTPYEGELRARAAAARRRPATCVWPAWLDGADLEGLYALADLRRLPVAVRGLRAPGARGDGPRRARRLLGPLVAARGRRRRGAALRPRGHRGDPRRRSSACWPTRPSASAWRAPGDSVQRASPGSAPRELTVAAYERALSQRA